MQRCCAGTCLPRRHRSSPCSLRWGHQHGPPAQPPALAILLQLRVPEHRSRGGAWPWRTATMGDTHTDDMNTGDTLCLQPSRMGPPSPTPAGARPAHSAQAGRHSQCPPRLLRHGRLPRPALAPAPIPALPPGLRQHLLPWASAPRPSRTRTAQCPRSPATLTWLPRDTPGGPAAPSASRVPPPAEGSGGAVSPHRPGPGGGAGPGHGAPAPAEVCCTLQLQKPPPKISSPAPRPRNRRIQRMNHGPAPPPTPVPPLGTWDRPRGHGGQELPHGLRPAVCSPRTPARPRQDPRAAPDPGSGSCPQPRPGQRQAPLPRRGPAAPCRAPGAAPGHRTRAPALAAAMGGCLLPGPGTGSAPLTPSARQGCGSAALPLLPVSGRRPRRRVSPGTGTGPGGRRRGAPGTAGP